jgi:4'-phosphopantetheinyl transferase
VRQTEPIGHPGQYLGAGAQTSFNHEQVERGLAALTDWRHPPKILMLAGDEVHVWRASLDLPVSSLLRLRQTLDAGELARARRFHFQEDRDHFIAAHGVTRSILARYLGTEPAALRFAQGPQRKPYLVMPPGQGRIHFNLTHSHELALLAVARDREVGIDIEYIRADVAAEPLAERFFSPQEVAALRALPASVQAEAFFDAWTCKEAYLKARGEGLTALLNQFAVSLVPGEPARLLWVQGDDRAASHWSLRRLDPGPGYAGALAAESGDWEIVCCQWVGEE